MGSRRPLYTWAKDSIILQKTSIEDKAIDSADHQPSLSCNYIFENILPFVLNYLPDIITWKDENHRFRGCNYEGAQEFGLDCPQDIIGKNDNEFDWGQKGYGEIFKQENQEVLSGKSLLIIGKYFISHTPKVLLIKKIPVLNLAKTQVVGLVRFAEEISQFEQLKTHLNYLNVILPEELLEEIYLKLYSKNIDVSLSPRENECLNYLVQGHSIKEMAKELEISNRTVESYIEQLKRKLNCRKSSEVVAKAIEFRLIDDSKFSIFANPKQFASSKNLATMA